MSQKDYIGFTLDLRKTVNVLAQDPSARAEIIAGLQDAPLALTTQLGAANLTAGSGEDTWCSVFPATVQGVQAGQPGLLYRNNTRGGKGDRIQMRLKKQPKDQIAHSAQTQTMAQVLPQQQNPVIAAAAAAAGVTYDQALHSLLQANAAKQNAAAVAQPIVQPTVQVTPVVAPAPVAAGVPADLAAALSGLNF